MTEPYKPETWTHQIPYTSAVTALLTWDKLEQMYRNKSKNREPGTLKFKSAAESINTQRTQYLKQFSEAEQEEIILGMLDDSKFVKDLGTELKNLEERLKNIPTP